MWPRRQVGKIVKIILLQLHLQAALGLRQNDLPSIQTLLILCGHHISVTRLSRNIISAGVSLHGKGESPTVGSVDDHTCEKYCGG